MDKKRLIMLASVLAIAAFVVIPAAAQAETLELVSSETNSLCVNPPAFPPTVNGKPNYAPLFTRHKGKFPDTGKSCAPETLTHPVAVGPPGEKAGPWNGDIPNASWVSIANTGKDSTNPPPKYYIYDATFTLPCGNQAAGSELSVKMWADNTAGAFLNGVPMKNKEKPLKNSLEFGLPETNHENFSEELTSPVGPADGWPFGPNVGIPGGFITGVNTLQFVVLDESEPYTGLDFSATVTVPPCVPHWYSNKKLIKEPERVPVATSGVITFHVMEGNPPKERPPIKCKKKDKEIIYNPEGGGAGLDEVTEFVLSGCLTSPSPCPTGTVLEIIAGNLNWPSHLIAPPPIRDVIENIELKVECSGKLIDVFTGTLMPTIGNSVDIFGAGSGALESIFNKGETVTVTGTEKLLGPKGDEKITAG